MLDVIENLGCFDDDFGVIVNDAAPQRRVVGKTCFKANIVEKHLWKKKGKKEKIISVFNAL